jgi:hypothetical protein
LEPKNGSDRERRFACGAMKKKTDDMARECAAQLKPFGKTIKDAAEFYIRHLNRKKSTGRRKGSGVYAEITRHAGIMRRMDWQQLRERLFKRSHRPQFDEAVLNQFEREMWSTRAEQQRATEEHLPHHIKKLIEQRRAEQAALSPEQFAERILNRDGAANSAAKEFQQYLKQNPVADLKSQWRMAETLLLPKTAPTRRYTDATARHIYEALHKQDVNGVLTVEGWRFSSKEDAMDAIHDLATRLKFALKKQAQKH